MSLHADPRVLGVEPESVEPPCSPTISISLGLSNWPSGEDPDNLTLGKQLLDSRHSLLPSPWSILRQSADTMADSGMGRRCTGLLNLHRVVPANQGGNPSSA